MALQYSTLLRNAQLNAIEPLVGTSAVLKIYDLTAGAPASCADPITGTILATINLPVDWLDVAEDGLIEMLGSWQDTDADNPGIADFFRLFASNGTTCHMQGTASMPGFGGDMILDNTNIAQHQVVTVLGFSIGAGNE